MRKIVEALVIVAVLVGAFGIATTGGAWAKCPPDCDDNSKPP